MLWPVLLLLQSRAVLDTQRVAAAVPRSPAGQVTTRLSTAEARRSGVTDARGLLAQLPLLAMRSARGETALSIRGARREQVAVTLDGLPLNDPSTGTADVADLPLAILADATLRAGADPLGAGGGSVGGTLALRTTGTSSATMAMGTFGARSIDAGISPRIGGGTATVAASLQEARNDFPFVNAAAPVPADERRVNNDEQRGTLAAGWRGARLHLFALGTYTERGMVGPANVRTYDADRARTRRALLRGQLLVGSTLARAAVRRFSLAYRDPTRPVLDANAEASAVDLEWMGALLRGAWRTGIGFDALGASGGVRQSRQRAFVGQQWVSAELPTRRWHGDAGVRLDAISGAGVQPSASAGVTWRLTDLHRVVRWEIAGRAAQAFRAPTLYDLYFGAPQRLQVRSLRPERVRVDAAVSVRGNMEDAGASHPRLQVEAALVAREVEDAIIWFPGNFGWSPANVGRERLRGAEAHGTLTWRSVALQAWGTRYHATLATGGLAIPTPYVARHEGVLQGRWMPARWTITTTTRVSGPRPFSAGPRHPAFELPAVARLDLAVAYRLRWRRRNPLTLRSPLLTLAIDNATGVRWQSVQGFPMPGRSWMLALHLTPP